MLFIYILDTYPNTDTASALKIFYEHLEKNNFRQPADFSMRGLIYPKYMDIPTPDKSAIMITQGI